MTRTTARPRTTRPARLAAAGAALVLVGGLAGCGGGSDEGTGDGSDSPSEASVGAEVGDDLLARPRQGVVLEGTDSEVSWRFPASYEASGPQQADSKDGSTAFRLFVGGKPDADLADETESLRTQLVPGAEADVEEETVGENDITFLTAGTETESARVALFQPEGADTTYAVFLRAGVPVDELPDERLEELRQMVGSIELGSSDG